MEWLRESLNSNMFQIIYALLYGIYKAFQSQYFENCCKSTMKGHRPNNLSQARTPARSDVHFLRQRDSPPSLPIANQCTVEDPTISFIYHLLLFLPSPSLCLSPSTELIRGNVGNVEVHK